LGALHDSTLSQELDTPATLSEDETLLLGDRHHGRDSVVVLSKLLAGWLNINLLQKTTVSLPNDQVVLLLSQEYVSILPEDLRRGMTNIDSVS